MPNLQRRGTEGRAQSRRGKRQKRRQPEVIVVGEELIDDRPLWQQFQRIGGNLTPQDVSTIILEADCGIISRLVNLANEARQKDGHLHSVLQTRELALKGLEWELLPPRDASGPEKKATEDLKGILEDSDNFPDLLHHLTGSGVYHGHATSETIYKRQKVRKRELLVPHRWKNIHANRFAFSQDAGELMFTEDGVTGIDLVETYPGKFVQYQPIVNGDAGVREGLARILIWLALFRNWDLRDWLQFGEIGWKPWRIGSYDKSDTHRKDVEVLKRAMKTLTTTGAAVKPDTVSIDVEWPKGVGSTVTSSHKELFDTMGAEMSKAVLGQTLTVEQGNRGSQSLGNVQDKVRGDILVADAIGEAAAITRHVVKPFYALNYSESVRPCRFIFHTEDSVDLAAFSTAIEKLVKAGLKIPADWVRNQGGIPEPKDDDELIGGSPEGDDDDETTDPDADPETGDDEDA